MEDLSDILMEFKVQDEKTEENLQQTADFALRQIEEKAYEADLLAAGIARERIYKIGFAFCGKDVCVKAE